VEGKLRPDLDLHALLLGPPIGRRGVRA